MCNEATSASLDCCQNFVYRLDSIQAYFKDIKPQESRESPNPGEICPKIWASRTQGSGNTRSMITVTANYLV